MAKQRENSNLARTLTHEDAEAKRNIQHRSGEMTAVRFGAVVAWTLLLSVLIVLFCTFIYGKVEISKLYSERSKLSEQLEVLESANISMQSEIAERMNMTKVEEYAKNSAGLQKLDRSQIEYIEIETPSVAEIKDSGDGDVLSRVKQWMGAAMEYLGL